MVKKREKVIENGRRKRAWGKSKSREERRTYRIEFSRPKRKAKNPVSSPRTPTLTSLSTQARKEGERGFERVGKKPKNESRVGLVEEYRICCARITHQVRRNDKKKRKEK